MKNITNHNNAYKFENSLTFASSACYWEVFHILFSVFYTNCTNLTIYLFPFLGDFKFGLGSKSFKSWTYGCNGAHCCSLHITVSGFRLSGSCSGAECKSILLHKIHVYTWLKCLRKNCCHLIIWLSGCSECHSVDLHHPVCLLPQALPWPLVPGWKPVCFHVDNNWVLCHDHWTDPDWSLSPGLLTWGGDVLLCRCKHLWYSATLMKRTYL